MVLFSIILSSYGLYCRNSLWIIPMYLINIFHCAFAANTNTCKLVDWVDIITSPRVWITIVNIVLQYRLHSRISYLPWYHNVNCNGVSLLSSTYSFKYVFSVSINDDTIQKFSYNCNSVYSCSLLCRMILYVK